MKCPKCQFENPSGIRYCLQCGERMLPLPPSKKPTRTASNNSSLKMTFLVMCSLVTLGFCVLLGTVVISLQSTRLSGLKTSFFPETSVEISNDSNKTSKTPNFKEQYAYVDFTTHTLSIPDSSLKIEFPAYSTCRYDYDPTVGQLIFEIETFDGLSITFTSSKLNASPYTKSEAEASVKTGLYYEIAGKEDEYYYILPSNGPTANATIVDCTHNRSTNITVYDQNYDPSKDEEHDGEVKKFFTMDQEADPQEVEEKSELNIETYQELEEKSPEEQESILKADPETETISQEKQSEDVEIEKTKGASLSDGQAGSKKAIYALEELLNSAKINS